MVSAQRHLPELRRLLSGAAGGSAHGPLRSSLGAPVAPGELALILGRPRWNWGLEDVL